VWGSGDAASHAALSDGVVLTPAGPWTDTVLALLRHLERAGWPGAPRPVGSGRAADGRMALTYVPGESTHPQAWADEVVGRVGELLRGLHDATASFVAPSAAVWQGHWLREIGEQDLVIGHGDPAPWNIVGPGRTPQFLVDWEYAGPVDRLTELAYAAWLNAQLHDDDIAAQHGLPDLAGRAQQLRQILDGYGLARGRRPELVDRMIEVAVRSARAEAVGAGVTPESTEAVGPDGYPVLWAIAWRARSAAWMLEHRRQLLAAVV
jgi:hypothetical protein